MDSSISCYVPVCCSSVTRTVAHSSGAPFDSSHLIANSLWIMPAYYYYCFLALYFFMIIIVVSKATHFLCIFLLVLLIDLSG